MANFFTRQAGQYHNQLVQSCSELMGLAEGLIADRQLNDAEILFLRQWLDKHDVIACDWPGDVIHDKINAVLEDGVITDEERAHVVDMLTKLIGGRLDRLGDRHRTSSGCS
jgi:hypothetical protein